MKPGLIVRVWTKMIRKIRYIIIGYSRSGTTVTHLAIKGHPAAVALNDELLVDPFFTKGISIFTHGNDYLEEKKEGYSALFDALTLIRANEQTLAHGAKTACNSHRKSCHLVRVLQNHLKDLKVIIIIRKDLVAQLGSALHGKKTGIMHSWYKGFDTREISQIKISMWQLTSYVINVHKMYAVLRELNNSHDVLEINYEDLLEDSSRFYARLFGFLDLPVTEPIWLESKKVMPPPEKYIKNYDRLKKRLADIENGALPVYKILYSRIMAHLFWIIRSKIPVKGRKKRQLLPVLRAPDS